MDVPEEPLGGRVHFYFGHSYSYEAYDSGAGPELPAEPEKLLFEGEYLVHFHVALSEADLAGSGFHVPYFLLQIPQHVVVLVNVLLKEVVKDVRYASGGGVLEAVRDVLKDLVVEFRGFGGGDYQGPLHQYEKKVGVAYVVLAEVGRFHDKLEWSCYEPS